MPSQRIIGARYEVRDSVGRGGMGVVYRCFDRVVGREVALKTLGDIQGRTALEMFYKEWRLLANLHHPNIVEIFDIGEFDDEGTTKPYFVMPLLPGRTLDMLMRSGEQALPLDRLVDIITQTCRGLQAIHDNGLIHRDIKPSNIFVLEANAVKLIDFGVAHLVGAATGTGVKGTVSYMSPEQVRAEECTASSDIFSLGVVCYEALTGTKPFRGAKTDQVFDAILNYLPPPISELNPAVNPTISRAVHKALAKQPRHRYGSASEFADTLQRALRGEPIPALDPARIQPRIQRAMKAFEQAKYEMASEILTDLEAAGHVDPALTALRGQIDKAARQKRVRDLLDRAQLGLEEDELTLALQNAEAALATAPDNDEALKLREQIQAEITKREVEESLVGASNAIEQYAFPRARYLLQRILDLQPDNDEATAMLKHLESREQAYRALRQKKEDLYRAAKEAWANSEFATAAEKLRGVLALESQAPDSSTSDTRANCANFLNLAEMAQSALESLRNMAERCMFAADYSRAISLCNEVASKYPGHLLPQGLRASAEGADRRATIAVMAELAREADAEHELERKLDVLRKASETFPNQPVFEQWARAVREELAVVNTAVAKAQSHEQHGRFLESLENWQTVRAIYPNFPGIETELRRVAGLAGVEYGTPTPGPLFESTPAAQPHAYAAAATVVEPSPLPPVQTRPPAPSRTPEPEPLPLPVVQETRPQPQPRAMPNLRDVISRLEPFAAAAGKRSREAFDSSVAWVRRNQRLPASLHWSYASIALICVGLIIAAFFVSQRSTRSRIATPAPEVHKARVVLKSPHPGALIRLNDAEGSSGNFNVEVAPGMYSLEVYADGYVPLKEVVNVPAEGLDRTLPAMQPLPSSIRLITDLQKGTVRLDDRAAVTLTESAEFAVDDLAPGKHVLTVSEGVNEARVEFTTADANPPRIAAPVKSKGLVAFAAGALGSWLQVATTASIPVMVDSKSPDETPDGSSVFRRLTKGAHEVVIAPGPEERRVSLDTSARPTLWLAAYSDRNVGGLIVTAGVDQFTVLVDGVAQQRRIREGSMVLNNLQPKKYKIAVVSEGYDRSAEQEIEVKKGSWVRHAVALTKTAQFAQLALRGMPAGTQLVVDGNAVGTVDAEGTLSLDRLEPGEHTLELRHGPQIKSTPVKRAFAAKESATLSLADFRVERAPAVLNITATPQNARIDWACGGGKPSGAATASVAASCAEGQATIKVSAGGFVEETRTLAVLAGGKHAVHFDLKRAEAAPSKAHCASGDLVKAGWQEQSGWYATNRNASLPCANVPGVYQFTLATQKGFTFFGKPLGWTVVGSGRTEFVLDKKSFGIKGQAKKNVEQYMGEGHITFQLLIDPDKVTVAARTANGWETLASTTGDFRKPRVEVAKDVKLSNFLFNER